MLILKKAIRKGFLEVKIDSLDDLWYLSHIITEGDIVSGKSYRKIRIGDSDNAKVVKKPFWLQIEVIRVEFSKHTDTLRVSGIIMQGPEDIAHGSHHTFNLEEGTEFKLEKKEFLSYQLSKLDEATSEKTSNILLVVLDREEAHIAILKKYGYEIITKLTGNVQKKGMDSAFTNFYKEVYTALLEYDSRYKLETIIVGSPAFFKDDFLKEAGGLKDKIKLATISSVGKTSFNELLKRDEVQAVLKKDKISKEANLVESVMKEISLNAKAVYGFDETSDAANAGAVEELLVSDSLILKMRQEEKYKKLDKIMQIVDKSQGKVNIISSDHDAGKQLDGLGGIAGLLRYQLR